MPPRSKPTSHECTPRDLALIKACEGGDLSAVQRLTADGANPLAEDGAGYNAIQRACSFGQREVVAFLLRANPRLANQPNSQGWTPGHSASLFGRVEIVRLLILNGAKNTERPGREPMTPRGSAVLSKKKLPDVTLGNSSDPNDYEKIIAMWADLKLVIAEERKRSEEEGRKMMEANRKRLAEKASASTSLQTAPSEVKIPISSSPSVPGIGSVIDETLSRMPMLSTEAVMDGLSSSAYHAEEPKVRSKSVAREGTVSLSVNSPGRSDEALHKIPALPQALTLREVLRADPKDKKEARVFGLLNEHTCTRVELARCLLLQRPESYEDRDAESGEYPLHLAAEMDDSEMVECIVHAGCSVDLSDFKQNTPLHLAARYGCIKSIVMLVKLGADVNQANGNGSTALHEAAAKCDPKRVSDTIMTLLGCDGVTVNQTDRKGFTALHSAARFGKMDALTLLISLGADPTLQSVDGWTPRDVAEEENRLLREKSSTIIPGIEAVIEFLKKAEEDSFPRNMARYRQWNREKAFTDMARSFYHAAEVGNIRELEAIFVIYPDVLKIRANGRLALHGAVYCFDTGVDVLQSLQKMYTKRGLAFPIDDHIVDPQGLADHRAPLHLAAMIGNLAVVRWLLENGADPTVRDAEGFYPLHLAAQKGVDEIVDVLLADKRVSVDAMSSLYWSPLHSAAQFGQIKTVQRLLDQGASLTLRGPNGENVLETALRGASKVVGPSDVCHKEVIRLFLSRGLKYRSSFATAGFRRESILQLLKEERYAGQAIEGSSVLPSQEQHAESVLRRQLLSVDIAGELEPVQIKMEGSNPGAIYLGKRDGLQWLGKMGYDTLPKEDERALGKGTRTRAEIGVRIDASQEKVGIDFYKLLAVSSETSGYEVPETHLAKLPIRNEFIMKNELFARRINDIFPESHRITETIFVMSRWCETFQPLEKVADPKFKKAWSVGEVPEYIMLKTERVSTDELVRLLAHARLLGDVDVCGVTLGNVGFRLGQAGEFVSWIKVDGTHMFKGFSADDRWESHTHLPQRGDPKDIQCDARLSAHFVKWSRLTERQKRIYIEEVAKGLALCRDKEMLDFMLFREGLFQQYGLDDEKVETTYMSWKGDYMKERVENVYADELAKYQEENPGKVDAWLNGKKRALRFPSLSDEHASAIYPSIPMTGKTTRLTTEVLSVFKKVWIRSGRWDAEELFKLTLAHTEGDSGMALRILGGMTTEYIGNLRKLLMSKGVSEKELDNATNKQGEKDGSIGALMFHFATRLAIKTYEELPFYHLMYVLQNFTRHGTAEAERFTKEYLADHPALKVRVSPPAHLLGVSEERVRTPDVALLPSVVSRSEAKESSIRDLADTRYAEAKLMFQRSNYGAAYTLFLLARDRYKEVKETAETTPFDKTLSIKRLGKIKQKWLKRTTEHLSEPKPESSASEQLSPEQAAERGRESPSAKK